MKNRSHRQNEQGNVLFLILIAVALFAALSYAVTQSSRSGSNDAGKETNIISGAQITQYPAGLRTSVIRMVIGGVANDELYFNPPTDFDSDGTDDPDEIEDNDADETDETRSVFHPEGGGAAYVAAPPEVTSTGAQVDWIFSGAYAVDRIGKTDGTAESSELVAFLPNVNRSVCQRINEQLGIPVVTDANGDGIPGTGAGAVGLPVVTENMTKAANAAGAGPGYIIPAADHLIAGDFSGQPFGCYDADDATAPTSSHPYVYYHVLVER